MQVGELQAAWEEYLPKIAEDYGEWDQRRLAAVGPHLDAMSSFLAGDSDIHGFRARIDSLTKTQPFWGFRGTSQMFFNQLVKAAEPEALEATLRQVLPAPADPVEAREKLEVLEAAVQHARTLAEGSGATQPGVGRINAFASFFWELQDREAWPTFFPNSRDVLERYGLLEVDRRQPDLYLDYRARIQELKETLQTDTWSVEHLLWQLGQGEGKGPPEGTPDPASPPVPIADLYASYRQQELHFPDELVTSLVLSLATKRFVILSGISGTGKTRLALGLAHYLESLAEDPQPAPEPPPQDATNIYVRLTAPKLQRGSISLLGEAQSCVEAALGLPERGASQFYATRLPNGELHEMRLNNVDFADSSRQLYRLYFRKEIA